MSKTLILGRPIASRWERFWATVVDGALAVLVSCVLSFTAAAPWLPSLTDDAGVTSSQAMAINLLFTQFVYLVLNGYLLATRGQTIGKWMLGTRIVSIENGEVPGFGTTYGIRFLFFWIVGFMPYLGGLFQLVNWAFVLGEERRCLHDRLARTVVVSST